ncbi:hypothetical protein [Streptomyces sp. NPDC088350]|uniref:hypothetical protein n=1 Tax=Streptomyces sp. NPDC088350 TaxID=3365854 RepID=UPI00382C9252
MSKHYYGQPIANATTMKVIGAYGKGTAARPPRDIDMLFVMPAEGTACSTDVISDGFTHRCSNNCNRV